MPIKINSPILIAIIAQLISLAALLAIIQGLLHGFEIILPLWAKILFQAVGAALLSFSFRQARWWILIQLIIPVAVVLALNFNIPSWFYLLGFFILLFFFWNSANERVPLYLSNKATWTALGDLLANEKEPIHFIDLGCGLAGTLVALAQRFPQHSFTGVETAPFPYVMSKLRCKISGLDNINILRKNMWDVDLKDFKYTYVFLSPEPMPKLLNKFNNEAKKGAKLISNSFNVTHSPAEDVIVLKDKRRTKLHIWIKIV